MEALLSRNVGAHVHHESMSYLHYENKHNDDLTITYRPALFEMTGAIGWVQKAIIASTSTASFTSLHQHDRALSVARNIREQILLGMQNSPAMAVTTKGTSLANADQGTHDGRYLRNLIAACDSHPREARNAENMFSALIELYQPQKSLDYKPGKAMQFVHYCTTSRLFCLFEHKADTSGFEGYSWKPDARLLTSQTSMNTDFLTLLAPIGDSTVTHGSPEDIQLDNLGQLNAKFQTIHAQACSSGRNTAGDSRAAQLLLAKQKHIKHYKIDKFAVHSPNHAGSSAPFDVTLVRLNQRAFYIIDRKMHSIVGYAVGRIECFGIEPISDLSLW